MSVHNNRTPNSRDDWSTPWSFFTLLDYKLNFTLDPCASIPTEDNPSNSKCDHYYTIEDDGLKQSWKGEKVFVNPPYSHKKEWIQKCYEEAQQENTKVVLLIPTAMETEIFHKYCMKAKEIWNIKGRIQFEINGDKLNGRNNLGSLLIIFEKHENKYPILKPFYHKEKDLKTRWCGCGDEILIEGDLCENCKFMEEKIELPEAIEKFMEYKKITDSHKIKPLEFEAFCQNQNYIVLKECKFQPNCVLKWLGNDCKTCEERKVVKGREKYFIPHKCDIDPECTMYIPNCKEKCSLAKEKEVEKVE